MQIIKYNLTSFDENAVEIMGAAVEMTYSEANLEVAKSEAYKGIVEVVDDGKEPEPQTPTAEERITELEEALTALLEGATE